MFVAGSKACKSGKAHMVDSGHSERHSACLFKQEAGHTPAIGT
jgi:formylmethanofuran dehydrogenase subunit B